MWEVTARRVTPNGEYELPTVYLNARLHDIRNSREARTTASYLFGAGFEFEVRAVDADR
ncbi:hypothetical protein C8K30_101463 [Promicromonospora sp. AC04]|uniref:hypothetical protein n=1 Tax=Promicromonospora sp. AC04 TaxID=2135723 RepID=UPI000D43127D|nr:hypothetical protein [Promicromonospora sp. AC04]PUB31944.1 hypothetical protein C8K30_101463 [Promicromonospora sp. AC04]